MPRCRRCGSSESVMWTDAQAPCGGDDEACRAIQPGFDRRLVRILPCVCTSCWCDFDPLEDTWQVEEPTGWRILNYEVNP